MKLYVGSFNKYKELKITAENVCIETGLLDDDEAIKLATEFIGTAYCLLPDKIQHHADALEALRVLIVGGGDDTPAEEGP